VNPATAPARQLACAVLPAARAQLAGCESMGVAPGLREPVAATDLSAALAGGPGAPSVQLAPLAALS